MKFFGTVFFIIAIATASMAQTPASSDNPSGIQILKVSWSIVQPEGEVDIAPGKPSTRMKTTTNDNSALGKPSARVQPVVDPIDEPDRRIPTEVGPPPARTNARTNSARTPHATKYLYQVTVKNTSTKKIKALDWEYIFTDSLDRAVVGQHRFQSRVKISPDEKKQLRESTLAPPTRTINAKTAAQNPQQPFIEQVRITRIEYADGSVWERDSR